MTDVRFQLTIRFAEMRSVDEAGGSTMATHANLVELRWLRPELV